MKPKTLVVFWASVAATVFLLGGTVASVEAVLRHASLADAILLALSLFGLASAALIAGRVLVVVGRGQRRSHSPDA